jgi:hypothetical protein
MSLLFLEAFDGQWIRSILRRAILGMLLFGIKVIRCYRIRVCLTARLCQYCLNVCNTQYSYGFRLHSAL